MEERNWGKRKRRGRNWGREREGEEVRRGNVGGGGVFFVEIKDFELSFLFLFFLNNNYSFLPLIASPPLLSLSLSLSLHVQ